MLSVVLCIVSYGISELFLFIFFIPLDHWITWNFGIPGCSPTLFIWFDFFILFLVSCYLPLANDDVWWTAMYCCWQCWDCILQYKLDVFFSSGGAMSLLKLPFWCLTTSTSLSYFFFCFLFNWCIHYWNMQIRPIMQHIRQSRYRILQNKDN